jgi:predicted NodU family carbamoyl transferase
MLTAQAACGRFQGGRIPLLAADRAFREASGVPMVLNTSFNENEPVVCTPQEALDCFLRTSMDLLVLGDTMVSRQDGAAK